jgi:hypothetical protein
MFSAILPLVLMVIGALVYAFSSNAKVVELGRLTFLAGVIGLAIGDAALRLGH